MSNTGKEFGSIFVPVLPMVRRETIEMHGGINPEPTTDEKSKPLFSYLLRQSESHLFGGVIVARLLKMEADSQGKTLRDPTRPTMRQLDRKIEQRKKEYLQQTGLKPAESNQERVLNLTLIIQELKSGNDPLMPGNQNFEQENPELFKLINSTSLAFMSSGTLQSRIGEMGAGAYIAYEAYRMQAEKDQGKS